ncbi:MAG: glutathione S-transferase family protein [Nitratireductor sp.]
MKLYIGNKKYSSWSFRPWIALTAKNIEFEEILIPFDNDGKNPKFGDFSPTSKVPTLVDEELNVWESLAILEYLADRFPQHGFWPTDINARAHARAISNEMHGGFFGIRGECPMNMARKVEALEVGDSVKKDVKRIEAIWEECLDTFGGPFLFGEFCNADAMYAPVVNRIEKYELSNHAAVKTYTKAMKALPAYKAWEEAGINEPWIVEADEA